MCENDAGIMFYECYLKQLFSYGVAKRVDEFVFYLFKFKQVHTCTVKTSCLVYKIAVKLYNAINCKNVRWEKLYFKYSVR